MKLIDADSLIEHAEVNCESSDFVEKLIDYVAEQEEVSISQGHEDDHVSRKTAIDALDRIFDRCEEIEAHLPEGDPDRIGYKMFPDYIIVWKYLHKLPSAQPERKKGKWIYSPEYKIIGNPYGHYRCDQCQTIVGYETHFCPDCGAEMER